MEKPVPAGSDSGPLQPFRAPAQGGGIGGAADRVVSRGKLALLIAGGWVVAIWAVEAWDFCLTLVVEARWGGGMLDRFGVRPRSLDGLAGIVLMPLLHLNVRHLLANTVPLFVLSFLLALDGWRRFVAATAGIVVISGLGVWLLGSTGSVHIGASGLVFGYMGALLTKGFMESRMSWVVVAVLVGVFVLTFGYLGELVPGRPGVSWASHFFGLLAGLATSWYLARRHRRAPEWKW